MEKKQIINDLKRKGKWKSQRESLRKSTCNPGEEKLRSFYYFELRGPRIKISFNFFFFEKKWG